MNTGAFLGDYHQSNWGHPGTLYLKSHVPVPDACEESIGPDRFASILMAVRIPARSTSPVKIYTHFGTVYSCPIVCKRIWCSWRRCREWLVPE